MSKKAVLLLSFYTLLASINPIIFGQSVVRNSTYGQVHTPKGNLHVLVIFIQNDNDTIDRNGWKHHQLPDFVNHENNDLISSSINDIGTKSNLSTWYSDMSMGEFKFTGDIFPEIIPVPANMYGNDSKISRGAVDYINKHYPDFNWAKYDNRTNRANWSKDNSSSKPDGKLDYVIMLHRKPGMNGYAGISGYNLKLKGKDQDYYITDGYTSIGTNPDANSISDLFIHEFGHNLYTAPHLGNANGVIGNYFRGTFGWSMSNTDKRVFYTCNAWERWYLGWTEIKHDIRKLRKDTLLEIDDYITTGDAVRIKIPHSEQFIWIENHQKKNQFDRHRFERNAFNEAHLEPLKGVYAYIENISPSRDKIHSFSKGANGMRLLHPYGKFDFTYKDSVYKEKKWWGQTAYDFYTKQKNPIDGNSLVDVIYRDYNHDGEIAYTSNSNGPDKKKKEFHPIYSIGDSLHCAWSGEYLGFQEGDEISLNSNVLALPNRRYNQYDKSLAPAYINGLKIKILSITNGKAKISISYNNYELLNESRWAGQEIVFQKDTNYPTIDPVLNVYGNLQITKSETPGMHKKVEGSFVRPTVFRVAANSTVHIKKGGLLSFDSQSSLVLEDGSKLIIDEEAMVLFHENTHLLVEKGAKVINNGDFIMSSSLTNQLPSNALITSQPNEVQSLDELKKTVNIRMTDKLYLRTDTPLYFKEKLVKPKKSRKIIDRFNKSTLIQKAFIPKYYYDFTFNGSSDYFMVRGRRFSYKGKFYKKKFLGI